MTDLRFLLWSNKHSMWWRADARGYTLNADEAGRYSKSDAIGFVVASSYNGRLDEVTCMVVAPQRAEARP
jgi:hypothetical protein